MKKIFIALAIILIFTMFSSMVYAATTETFEVVDDQVCTIKINDYCDFEKKMTSYDLSKRQVTIQLKVTNNSVSNQPTGEIMLVLDNSNSMNTNTTPTRQELVYSSAKSLISKMLTNNNNLKVGIVQFSTNSDVSQEGTIADASLVSELSNDSTVLINAIDNIEANGARTDLEAGITLASQYFTNTNTNKYIIVFTDGVPNVAIDYDKTYYSDDVVNKTKSKLQSLASNYNLVTMLTGVSDTDLISTPGGNSSAKDYVEKVFGTTSNPTAGKFYYITDNEIEQTITNNIYNDLLPQSQSITNIKINDFFPQEIVDNFDFAYVSNPTKGTISQSIDGDNKIVWELDELASGETATVQYTLTLKDNYDSSIVNKILDTNEKVDVNYKDFDGTDKTKTSEDTPKVRITVPLKGEDKTTAPTIIPKTGKIALISIAIIFIVLAGASGTGILKINHDIKKQ